MLRITQLSAQIEETLILKKLDLTIKPGEVHAIMGPNGSGKSTLAHVLAGHPQYKVINGTITLQSKDITQASPEERALGGLFLAFQYPIAIPGATIGSVLRLAYNNLHKENSVDVPAFRALLEKKMQQLHISQDFADRSLNEGFSGGEKKKLELLQALLLDQPMLVFDEIDSGLDVDALRIVADGMNQLKSEKRSMLIITHYKRILEYIKPDVVHIMVNGSIVKSGNASLVDEVEKKGYESKT